MNWLSYISWLAGPALQITLLVFMVRRQLHRAFPRFFSYIVFQLVKTAVLFVTYRYFAGALAEGSTNYFDAYWAGNAVSVLLAVAVMDEILHRLFRQYGGIQTLASTIFRWACGLLVLVSILGAISNNEGSADRVVAAVLSFERSVRLMQCGLFLLIMLLCRVLKHCWRQPVFGVALGFGMFASIELILISVVTVFGNSQADRVSLVQSLAYNAVTVLWIGYLSQQVEAVPVVEMIPRARALNLALAMPNDSVAPADTSFLASVEQAVDRVLSRHTWPTPPTNGSQIVGRKPGPEERN
jgi:hypothetical protein